MNRLLLPFGAAPVFLGLICGFSFAADAPPGTQQWFRGQNPPLAPPPPLNGGDFGQNNQPPQAPPTANRVTQQNLGGSDFPTDQLQDWVIANARYAYSRAMFHRAQREQDDVFRMAQFTFEQSREYQDAVAAEKHAYDTYVAARQHALQSVLKDPRYVASLQLRDKTADQIAQIRARHRDVPGESMVALASLKLQFASDAHAMEAEALDRDDAVKTARQRMVEANARVTELRNAFDNSLRTNPQVLQSRRNVEDARVALITSEAYLNASGLAAGMASDFAFYRHRWDGIAAPQFGWVGPGWGF